jgi:hypothetical protein
MKVFALKRRVILAVCLFLTAGFTFAEIQPRQNSNDSKSATKIADVCPIRGTSVVFVPGFSSAQKKSVRGRLTISRGIVSQVVLDDPSTEDSRVIDGLVGTFRCLNLPRDVVIVEDFVLTGDRSDAAFDDRISYETNRINRDALFKPFAHSMFVREVSVPSGLSLGCRNFTNLFGNPSKVGSFLRDAFNQELWEARKLSPRGLNLSLRLLKAEFSSLAGTWDLHLKVLSADGKSFEVKTRHAFESSILGELGCRLTAAAFPGAVQSLMRSILSDPTLAEMAATQTLASIDEGVEVNPETPMAADLERERKKMAEAMESERRKLIEAENQRQQLSDAVARENRRVQDAEIERRKLAETVDAERQKLVEAESQRQKLADAIAQESRRAQEAEADRKKLSDVIEAERRKFADAEAQRIKLAAEVQTEREKIARLDADRAEKLRIANASVETVQKNPNSVRDGGASERVTGPRPVKRKALVIGNDAYAYISRLDNAKADARAVTEKLTGLGFSVSMHLDVSERSLKEALRNFKSSVDGGDEVILFYAGHGVQIASTNYLLPIDIRGDSEEQVKDEAILLQRFLDDMQERRARLTLAILDACRDNPFKVSGRSIGTRGLAPTAAATGQMIIFSAGVGQQALDKLGPADKQRNSLFTRTLLGEIDRPNQSVDRLLRAVREKVVQIARSVGHDQVPAIYDQVVGDFYLK